VTPEEEFAARSQLKWQRDGDEWVLLYRRRRIGRVVPDPANPRMYRSLKSGDFSDISNLSSQMEGRICLVPQGLRHS
jgi:hypothetical protein